MVFHCSGDGCFCFLSMHHLITDIELLYFSHPFEHYPQKRALVGYMLFYKKILHCILLDYFALCVVINTDLIQYVYIFSMALAISIIFYLPDGTSRYHSHDSCVGFELIQMYVPLYNFDI